MLCRLRAGQVLTPSMQPPAKARKAGSPKPAYVEKWARQTGPVTEKGGGMKKPGSSLSRVKPGPVQQALVHATEIEHQL